MLGKGHAKPQKLKTEESERLPGEINKINFIYLGFEGGKVAGFEEGRRRQEVSSIARSCDEEEGQGNHILTS